MSTNWEMMAMAERTVPLIALDRIKKEMREQERDPKPDIHIVADESDIRKQHALIIGPAGTPYEGGFFYFRIQYPMEYPSRPPHVRLMTTAGDTVRFNPNLYSNGKVCLSILGTWTGTPWSPALTLSTVLLSIQSLMNEEPYHNEPGYEKSKRTNSTAQVKSYNDIITHETLRVAVCGMLENYYRDTQDLPADLRQIIEQKFPSNYNKYVDIATNKKHLNGSMMKDPFGTNRGVFDFESILRRLNVLRDKYGSTQPSSSSSNGKSQSEPDFIDMLYDDDSDNDEDDE